jgi:hypothetical protein
LESRIQKNKKNSRDFLKKLEDFNNFRGTSVPSTLRVVPPDEIVIRFLKTRIFASDLKCFFFFDFNLKKLSIKHDTFL